MMFRYSMIGSDLESYHCTHVQNCTFAQNAFFFR
jgi:hypothetical protein